MTVITEYLKKIAPAQRKELERIRVMAKKIVPESEEVISYNMPTLKYKGKPFLGFDAHKNHIGIYPYSGQVMETLKNKLAGYGFSSGAIRVPFDKPISENLLKQIIKVRLKQIADEQKQWKTCSRGHKFQGNGPCPICWPGRLKKHTSS